MRYFFLILLCFPFVSFADVTLDNWAQDESASNDVTLTLPMTTDGSGATDLLIYVGDQSGDTLTSLTYGGVSATLVQQITRSPNEGSLEIYVYHVSDPNESSTDIIAVRSGTTGTLMLQALSFDGGAGVSQSASVNCAGSACGTLTNGFTVTADGSLAVDFAMFDNGSLSAGSSQTETVCTGGIYCSYTKSVSAGALNSTINASSADGALITVIFSPSGGGGGGGSTVSPFSAYSTTTQWLVINNPNQDYFNGVIIFFMMFGSMIWIFKPRK